jgi:hypothetical protein
MSRYIWAQNEWMPADAYWEKRYAELTHKRSELPAPTVISDIEEYRSPIDGKLIGSRKQRRDDLRAHGCIEWEPGIRQSVPNGRDKAKKLTRIDDKPKFDQ